MCHYFGYIFWVAPGFLGTFLGYFWIFGNLYFCYSRIFGYNFFGVKFGFFKNNPDFDMLLMMLWNVACRALVSYFLHLDLTYSCRKEWQ